MKEARSMMVAGLALNISAYHYKRAGITAAPPLEGSVRLKRGVSIIALDVEPHLFNRHMAVFNA